MSFGPGELSEPLVWPAEGVSAAPFRVFHDDEIYDLEQDRIFRGPVWNFVGLEIEIPQAGDWRTSHVGDTPVIMLRDEAGDIQVLVNRCAHKGALVCMTEEGHAKELTCVYHNWVYGLDGGLKSVAFARGVNRKGGMPDDFDRASHGLKRLRVATFCGVVFATFSDAVGSIEDYLGPDMQANMRRVLGRPIRLLGRHTQFLNYNWKLYIENVKDSYHASLLHLFFNTFKLNRLSMSGGIALDEHGWHHISYSKMATDRASEEYNAGELRATRDDYGLADPTLLDRWDEFEDGITLAIQTVFPAMVVQQTQNSIALRLAVPRGVQGCELFWWVLGFEDDDERKHRIRMKQSNLIGPAGLISMEDGVIGEFVQRGIAGEEGDASVIAMGGRDVRPSTDGRVTETAVRGFWQGFRTLTGL